MAINPGTIQCSQVEKRPWDSTRAMTADLWWPLFPHPCVCICRLLQSHTKPVTQNMWLALPQSRCSRDGSPDDNRCPCCPSLEQGAGWGCTTDRSHTQAQLERVDLSTQTPHLCMMVWGVQNSPLLILAVRTARLFLCVLR